MSQNSSGKTPTTKLSHKPLRARVCVRVSVCVCVCVCVYVREAELPNMLRTVRGTLFHLKGTVLGSMQVRPRV